jgi:hypothetical protein
VLRIHGALGDEAQEFVVALGKGAQEKHQFRVGDRVLGAGELVADSRLETADIYKASGLKIVEKACGAVAGRPPFLGIVLVSRSTASAAIDASRRRPTRRGRHGRCLAGRACRGRRRTGSTRMPRRTGGQMIDDVVAASDTSCSGAA